MQKYLEPRGKWYFYYLQSCTNNKCEWKRIPFLKKKNQKVICIYRFSPFFKQRKAVVALLCFFWRLSDYFSYIQQHPLPYNTFYHFLKYVLIYLDNFLINWIYIHYFCPIKINEINTLNLLWSSATTLSLVM